MNKYLFKFCMPTANIIILMLDGEVLLLPGRIVCLINFLILRRLKFSRLKQYRTKIAELVAGNLISDCQFPRFMEVSRGSSRFASIR